MAILDIFRRSQQRDVQAQPASAPASQTSTDTRVASRDHIGSADYVSTKDLALKVATVYRCADILSKSVAQLPLRICRNMGGYYVEDSEDIFGLHYLLKWKPNERLSAFELKRSLMLQLMFEGNAYLVPEMYGYGESGYDRLCLLVPNSCTYIPIRNEYVINDVFNGICGTYPARSVIHVKNLGIDGGFRGLSTLQNASRIIAISNNADIDNIETFKSGGLLRGFVTGKGGQVPTFGAVQDKQMRTVADSIEQQINSGKNIFNLPGEMSFQQIQLSPKDIELLSTKEFNVIDICRFFGVHPDKVFAQNSSNYKASELSQVSFLTDTLQPYLEQIANEMQIKLIPRSLMEDYLIDFDTEPLMQTDLNSRAAWMKETIAAGARTPNEWRRKLGQVPVEGGDDVLVSANLVPLNSAKLRGEATQNT